MRSPSAEGEANWREAMARQVASGLNVAQFCQREHLSGPSFYSWKRKLRGRDTGGGLSGVENGGETRRSRFVRVQIEPSVFVSLRSSIRIRWPPGIQLEIPFTVNCDTIDQLFRPLSKIASLALERLERQLLELRQQLEHRDIMFTELRGLNEKLHEQLAKAAEKIALLKKALFRRRSGRFRQSPDQPLLFSIEPIAGEESTSSTEADESSPDQSAESKPRRRRPKRIRFEFPQFLG